MSHLQQSDPECKEDTAIRDLLIIVRTKLLVVELDPRNPANRKDSLVSRTDVRDTPSRYRATAAEYRDSLTAILAKIKQQPASYLCSGKSRHGVRLPLGSELLSPGTALRIPTRHKTNGASLAGAGLTDRAIREYSVS